MPLFVRLAPVLSIAVLYSVRLKELFARRDTIKGQVRETGTLKLFMAVGMLVTLGGCAEYWLKGHSAEWITFGVGWAVSIASFAIRWRAIAALGKFWSVHVEIRNEHQFVQSGPFRWVRHPAYFSMILEIVGACLILNSWITLAAALAVFVPVLIKRVRIEEGALIEKFGEPYRAYRRTVPAILPWKGQAL